MWNRLANGIIKYRLLLIILIGLITVFMGYYASKVEMSYDFARTVPPNDPDMIMLNQFKAQFGEDGNVIAVGMKDSAIFQLKNFEALRELTSDIKKIEGVNDVLSLPAIKMILKDTAKTKFYLAPVFPDSIRTQQDLDSAIATANGQKFYSG